MLYGLVEYNNNNPSTYKFNGSNLKIPHTVVNWRFDDSHHKIFHCMIDKQKKTSRILDEVR
jgi:hypothetical protein